MKSETVGGEILVKQEPGQPPKLSRSSSQKIVARPPQLFSHFPDSTADALATFEQIEGCEYANKYMGYTEHAMECDCAEEWGMYPCLFVSGFGSFLVFLSLIVLLWSCHLDWRGCKLSCLVGSPARPFFQICCPP